MAGIRFFSAKFEMRENMSCKLYKIDESFGSIELPHAHDYVQIWYVARERSNISFKAVSTL